MERSVGYRYWVCFTPVGRLLGLPSFYISQVHCMKQSSFASPIYLPQECHTLRLRKKVMQHSRPDTMTSQDYTPSPPFPPPEHRSPSTPANPPLVYSSSPPTLASPIPFPSPPPAPLPTRAIPSPFPSPHRPTPTPTLWSPSTAVPSSHPFPPGSTARNAEIHRYAGHITPSRLRGSVTGGGRAV